MVEVFEVIEVESGWAKDVKKKVGDCVGEGCSGCGRWLIVRAGSG